MTFYQRIAKRLIIASAYLAIFSFIGFGIFYIFRTKPSCIDRIQNQGEEKVDCGGPCAPCEVLPEIKKLEIVEKKIITVSHNKYDLLAKIKNPNSRSGMANLNYTFLVYDEGGEVIGKQQGTSFILPSEEKYIFGFNLELNQEPARLEMKIMSFEQKVFKEYREPDIVVSQREFSLMTGGSEFAQLKAKIKNQSNFDFWKISAKAVIRDGSGNPVAINETSFNSVISGEEREMILNWREPFLVSDVAQLKIEIDPEANVFDQENFMKAYGSSEQYRSYNILE